MARRSMGEFWRSIPKKATGRAASTARWSTKRKAVAGIGVAASVMAVHNVRSNSRRANSTATSGYPTGMYGM